MVDEGGKRALRMLAKDQFPPQGSAELESRPRQMRLGICTLSSILSSQQSAPPVPRPRKQAVTSSGADSADREGPEPGLAGTAPRELPTQCITGSGMDPCSRHFAPCKLGH